LTTLVERDTMRPLSMSHASEEFTGSKPRRIRWRLAFMALGAILALAIILLLGVGRWLFVEDPLEKAQAIVVLSGRLPMRAIDAARLYNAGYAAEVWLTRPSEPAASLQAMHIAYLSEDFFNSRVLMHEGVPATAIRVLEPPIENTVDELRAAAGELERQNGAAVIIVTTKAHTRRVRTLWREVTGARRRAIVRAAANDPFEPGRWWRTTGDALDVVREVLGLLNAWTGLPLRPST
jgi:uncharacterized SAM-binding protein YcdF (DUF218 family)